MMNGLPRRAGLMQIVGVDPRTDLMGNLVKFDLDPVALPMRMGSQLLLWRKRCFRIAVSLTHRATSCGCGGELLPFPTQ